MTLHTKVGPLLRKILDLPLYLHYVFVPTFSRGSLTLAHPIHNTCLPVAATEIVEHL